MIRSLLAPLVALVVAASLMGPAQAAPPTARSGATYLSGYERNAIKATNAARVRHDLGRLRHGSCLQRYAERQAARMAASRTMYHQDLGPVLGGCGLSMVGENVAVGYPTGRSVVRRGWMRSSGHRDNILQPKYRRIAVGARRGSDGRMYVAQVFGRRA